MSLTRTLALAAVLALSTQGAHAADPDSSKGMTAQQAKMKSCNADAAGKTGDARKTFMASCLSNKTEKKLTSSQERMKTCNAEAKGKTGADRKTFMSSCLKST